jgi:phage terminase Nu1 subunit (DNA packaging protein)
MLEKTGVWGYVSGMKLTTSQLAMVFDVSVATIGTWKTNGCPNDGHNQWDLKDVVYWWAENIYEKQNDIMPGADMDSDIMEAKRKYIVAKAEAESIKVELLRGSVIKIDDIVKAGAWRVAELSNSLSALSLRLPSLLIGKTEIEMRSIISDEVWRLRDAFTRTGAWFVDSD